MFPFLIVGALLLGGYLLTKGNALASLGIAPSARPDGIPVGTIQVGTGSTAVSASGPGGPNAQQIAGLGFTSLGAVGAGSAGGIFGSGAAAAGTAAGSAIPIIGAGVAVVGTVVGLIEAHHKAALAAEGKALNDADPRAIQTFALIVQATAKGEIRDTTTAQNYVNTTISAYYGEVKPIQKGTWTYKASDWTNNFWPDNIDTTTGMGSGVRVRRPEVDKGGNPPPSTCNAACYVGHYWIERGGFVTMAAVKDILAGNHGQAIFPELPAHATQSGYPLTTVYY